MDETRMHTKATDLSRNISKAVLVLAVCTMALPSCSPGGVVAGTIGAAGAVAGTAVDVVLRSDIHQGVME